MSTPVTPALPGAGTPAPAAPAKALTAIEVIEKEIVNFFRQKEQAVANIHAVDGAIQGAQHLLAKLKAEAVKAEAFAKAEAEKVEAEVVKGIHAVEAKKL